MACFRVGRGLALGLAPPTLRTRIGSVPARWHIVSATGVVFFWAFHHERLHPTG